MRIFNQNAIEKLWSTVLITGGLLLGLPLMEIAEADPKTESNSGDLCRVTAAASPQQASSLSVHRGRGNVDIRLVNQTNSRVCYQVIGETRQRLVSPQAAVTLQNLNLPATVTFFRPDRGFLQVSPRRQSDQFLQVTLNSANRPGQN